MPRTPQTLAPAPGAFSLRRPPPGLAGLLILVPTLETHAPLLPTLLFGTLFTLRLLTVHLNLEAPSFPPVPSRDSVPLLPSSHPNPAPRTNGPTLLLPFLCCDLPAFAGIVREPVGLARGGPGCGCTLPSNTGAPRLAEAPFPIARVANVTPEGRLCRWAAWA